MISKLRDFIPKTVKDEITSSVIRMLNKMRRIVPVSIKHEIKSFIKEPNECIACGVRFVVFNQVPGDYLEFGCSSGSTFCHAYKTFRNCREEMLSSLETRERLALEKAKPRFFAFDSFEGLPASSGEKDCHPYFPIHWKEGSFKMSQQGFRKILVSRGIDVRDVFIIKGWYDQTLTAETKVLHRLNRASVVHIDCDYYESAILALDFVTDLVDDGTVIIFDDYNYFRGSPSLGERKAFSEWLSNNPHIRATELARHNFDKVAFFLNINKPS